MAEATATDNFQGENKENIAVTAVPVVGIPGCSNTPSIVYMHSNECLEACNNLPRVAGRADMVHSLIEAYGLHKLMRVVAPTAATIDEMMQFHSRHYLKLLKKLSKLEEDDEDKTTLYTQCEEEYGVGYDCPVPYALLDRVAMVTGASINAARLLNSGECKVAINWYGGWHHAKKDESSGFCYINDIVLAILTLREKFSHVLYVDLDLHHGDGVQDAFYSTGRVMTVSFHHYDGTFYPGTGHVMDSGSCRGTYHTVNVPLREGVRDYEFFSLFTSIMSRVRTNFNPQAVVIQCGADGLNGDPMDSFNLTHLALARCVHHLQHWGLPLLILGGGGYLYSNAAICWTYITAMLLNRQLPKDIPDHKYFTDYGPTFELTITPGNRINKNTRAYLIDIFSKIMTNLNHMKKFKEEMIEKHSHNIKY